MKTKKHLLPQVDRYFKANLHTHSTISDGKLTREEVKEAYKALGYQILCLTDHNVIANHSDMNEPDFLMLTGVEIDYRRKNHPKYDGQVYHLNFIAKRPDNLWYPGPLSNRFAHSQEYKDKMQCEGMPLEYCAESVNATIAKANEKGFLVMYNHPTWSCQSYADYAPLKGLWALELRNGEVILSGINENNARVYKDLLNLGNHIYPVGADDMHKPRALGQAWIMVGAKELTYDSVITALESGDFYMSCGPQIHSLELSENTLKITCSDARSITLESHGRFARRVLAEGDNWIHETEFDLTPLYKRGGEKIFIYLTVTAPDGTYATTRPYYLNDLG